MAAFFKRFDVRVTAVYGIVAALWIIISDRLLAIISPQRLLWEINTWKGLGFVAVTALALFVIISREARHRTEYEQALQSDLRALEQAEATEREQGRFAEALRDSLFALTASLDVDQVMQQILESAAAVVPSEAGSIVLFEDHHGRIAYTRGFPAEFQTLISE